MAEAHQLLLSLPLLDLFHEGGDVLYVADLPEHPKDRLVRTAVERAVERGDRARDARVRVRLGGTDAAHDARRAVLLVIGMQDEEDVERLLENRIHDVLRLGHLPEHREEVTGVGELVVGVDVGEADGVAVGESRDRRHLRHEPDGVMGPLALVVDQLGVRVEGGERGDGRLEHPHRMRVVTEPLRELLDVLVEIGVRRNVARESLQLVLRREFAVPEEPCHLEEARFLGQLFDRVAPVLEDPLVAVDVGDARDARGGVEVGGVVGHHPEVAGIYLDLPEVHRPYGVVLDGNDILFPGPVVPNSQGVLAHPLPLPLPWHAGLDWQF